MFVFRTEYISLQFYVDLKKLRFLSDKPALKVFSSCDKNLSADGEKNKILMDNNRVVRVCFRK